MTSLARFPFSAVVGQDEARMALLLAAVDPGIGGVLLRGDKGSAKSTLARGLAGMLPGGAPFVELPLGATEDRVLGTIDLKAALTEGDTVFRPGLLAAAHGGVLYVDEVNLLPDHLVDVLLDVAGSGVNRVERDGVSHSHPARFVLVGSMNPEEGELRPQLLDRFGLSVEIKAPVDPRARAEVVRRRLTHDAGGRVDGGEGDIVLRARLAASMPADLPDTVVDFACRLAVSVGAEGLRADLVLCRAAAAFAGWEGRSVATSSDVERVAGVALGHRRRRRPFDPPTLNTGELERALASARQSFADAHRAPAPEPPPEPVDEALLAGIEDEMAAEDEARAGTGPFAEAEARADADATTPRRRPTRAGPGPASPHRGAASRAPRPAGPVPEARPAPRARPGPGAALRAQRRPAPGRGAIPPVSPWPSPGAIPRARSPTPSPRATSPGPTTRAKPATAQETGTPRPRPATPAPATPRPTMPRARTATRAPTPRATAPTPRRTTGPGTGPRRRPRRRRRAGCRPGRRPPGPRVGRGGRWPGRRSTPRRHRRPRWIRPRTTPPHRRPRRPGARPGWAGPRPEPSPGAGSSAIRRRPAGR